MKKLSGQRIGFAVTGSFCTFERAFQQAQALVDAGAVITPVFSEHAAGIDTRFGKAADHIRRMEEISQRRAILTIDGAEPLGPKNMLDCIVVAPCTSNTLGKLALGLVDTTVTMAVKSMLRNEKPVVLALATNDALRVSSKNLGVLLNAKHYYFVPLGQDAPGQKPSSMVAHFERLPDTVVAALEGRQIQPLIV
ncbi:MAG: dipicolinate synthase subunit B [Ruminococcus sp.]|nr:dipicolinate synthase subunit B [Ruminococcus sp.]